MQLVRSEPLSEDTLSLVATDSGDSGAVHLGYNLICLWNQVSSVGSRSCHVKQVTRGSQRDETLHDSRVNINLCYQSECEVYSIKTPPVWSHRGHWVCPALMKQGENRPQTLFIWVWLSKGTFAPTGPFFQDWCQTSFYCLVSMATSSLCTWITETADRNRGSIYGPNWRAVWSVKMREI